MKRTYFALGLIVAVFCASVGLYFGVFQKGAELKKPKAIVVDKSSDGLLDPIAKPPPSPEMQAQIKMIESQSSNARGGGSFIKVGSGTTKKEGAFIIDGDIYQQTTEISPDGKSAVAGIKQISSEDEE